MVGCICREIKKDCYLPWFLLAVCGVAALCMAAEVDTDSTGKSLSVFTVLVQNKLSGNTQDITKSGLFLWRAGMQGWLVVFAPLLLTFGYIISLSEERQNGQIRFFLIRSGNLRYCVSKVAGGAISGGILFAVGYALYGLLLVILCPSWFSFPVEEQNLYMELYFGNSIYIYVLKRMIGAFLYGMFGSTFGIGTAICFRDKYMLLCLPFLLNYSYQQVIGKMITDRLARGAESVKWLEAFYLQSIVQISMDRYWMTSVLFMTAIYFVLIWLFFLRIKKGETRWLMG